MPDYLTHSVTAIIYIYGVIHPSLICIELRLIKIHWI